jgi:hypothetical protein
MEFITIGVIVLLVGEIIYAARKPIARMWWVINF